jgi:hypothetical protein
MQKHAFVKTYSVYSQKFNSDISTLHHLWYVIDQDKPLLVFIEKCMALGVNYLKYNVKYPEVQRVCRLTRQLPDSPSSQAINLKLRSPLPSNIIDFSSMWSHQRTCQGHYNYRQSPGAEDQC